MNKSFFPLKEKVLPVVPHWRRMFGVGAVALGLALGSGELILWPHLVTKFGLGILWGALLGILFEYFINQEVARHSLATGESFFMSSGRILPKLAFFWLLSAFLLYIWPGWSGAMGATLVALFGWGSATIWSWASLALILFFVLTGKKTYNVMENMIKITVSAFFILLIVASFLNLNSEILKEAFLGMINFGWLPDDITISVFMAAVVFAGAGGLLNLCVSFWYRDKGFGMGSYAGKIQNPITKELCTVSTTGYKFDMTSENLLRWKRWMRFVRIDQGVFFGFLGVVGLLLLSLNAYAVLSPLGIAPEGIDIIKEQAHVFGGLWGRVGSILFLVIAYLALFSTLWIILDAFTRIVGDIVYTNASSGPLQRYFKWAKNLSAHTLYYLFFILLIIINAILLPFGQPFLFLVTSAVLSGAIMAVYIPILLYVNNTRLPKEIRPSFITNIVLVLATIFFSYFSFIVFLGYLT